MTNRRLLGFILCFQLLSFGVAWSQGTSSQGDFAAINQRIAQLEANQANYRIEKDLLKDAYNSNIQTINTVLAAVLAIFTIIGFFVGFFGLRDINRLRREYSDELKDLRQAKADFDTKAAEIIHQQEAAKEQWKQSTKSGEEQNKRLQILELKEKIELNLNNRNYNRALEYSAIATELDSKDVGILNLKALIYWKLRKYSDAIRAYEELLTISPDEQHVIANLAELYLLAGAVDSYKELKERNVAIFASAIDKIDVAYFDLLCLFRKREPAALLYSFLSLMRELPKGKVKRSIWSYEELSTELAATADSKEKQIIMDLSAVLSGNLSPEDVLTKYEESQAAVTAASPAPSI